MRFSKHHPTLSALSCFAISAVLSLTLALTFAATSHAIAPTLSFTSSTVTVAPGQAARLVWFGVAREFFDAGVTVVPYSGIGEAKIGETVTITPNRGVSESAVWAAVDLGTGEVAMSFPDGSPADVTTIQGDPKSGLHKLDVDTDYVYLLLVRPGVGAWISKAGDGGPSDEDGLADGKLGALLSQMTPVGDSPAVPSVIAMNDVVLAINPGTLAAFAAGVTQ